MFETLASGGILGLLGSVCSKGFKWLETRQQSYLTYQQFEQDLKRLQLRLQLTSEHQEQQTQRLQGMSDALVKQASYKHDVDSGAASRWVINVIRLVRPLLTLGLLVLTGFIWQQLHEAQSSLQSMLIESVLFCMTVAITWWFGDRAR